MDEPKTDDKSVGIQMQATNRLIANPLRAGTIDGFKLFSALNRGSEKPISIQPEKPPEPKYKFPEVPEGAIKVELSFRCYTRDAVISEKLHQGVIDDGSVQGMSVMQAEATVDYLKKILSGALGKWMRWAMENDKAKTRQSDALPEVSSTKILDPSVVGGPLPTVSGKADIPKFQ